MWNVEAINVNADCWRIHCVFVPKPTVEHMTLGRAEFVSLRVLTRWCIKVTNPSWCNHIKVQY